MREKILSGNEIPVSTLVLQGGDNWQVVRVNDAAKDFFGIPGDKLQGMGLEELVYHKDLALFKTILEQAGVADKVASCEVRVKKKDKGQYWVQARCSNWAEEEDHLRVVVALCDINQQKETEQKLLLLNKQYEILNEIAKEIPFDLDVENWKLFRSKLMLQLMGNYEDEEGYLSFEEEMENRIHPMDREEFVTAMKEAAAAEATGTIDYRMNINANPDEKKYIWFRTFYSSVMGEDDRIVRIIGRTYNIDKDKMLQDEVKRDPLTRLLNKMETQKEIERLFQEYSNGSYVLFIIDVDNFKAINDTFGHTYGDNVISDVATQIRSNFRSDDVVGRIGGDEFAVLMKDVTIQQAEEKAKLLCKVLNRSYTGEGVTRQITASIGLAVYGVDGNTYHNVFEKADHAMYRAKERGKNGYQIACSSDVGPIRVGNKAMDARKPLKQRDREFLGSVISLMTHAKNVDGSLGMLLKRIADREEFDMILLAEEHKEPNTLLLSNYYSSRFESVERGMACPFNMDLHMFVEGQVYVLSPEELKTSKVLPYVYKNYWKPSEYSVGIGRFEFMDGRMGLVYYVAADPKRDWNDSKLDLLQELTRIISIFITMNKRMIESQAEIRHIRRRDSLTGLYNIEAFKECAQKILQEADENRIYALEYMDINNFGYVNDNYGYQVGDKILKLFVEDSVRQPFYEVGCRLHSDFFIRLLSARNLEDLKKHLSTQHQRFANMHNHQYPGSGMGIASGVYLVDSRQVDLDMGIENATLAWKTAKLRRQKDIVFFDPEFRRQRQEEQQVVGEFYEALYHNDFCVYLQPKFEMGTRKVYGAEALARWIKPDGTVIPPAVFIGPLEKIGYVTELDFFIFEEVLKIMSRWKAQGERPLVVSCNFSGRHFDDGSGDFLTRIFNLVGRYNVPPKNIEIEITEGVMVKNVEMLMNCVTQLHRVGFRVAVDDFGTGYSSLSVMMDITADVVKMDKSFIDKGVDEKRRDLIGLIGKLVESAGKEIIFEGVETEEQEKVLLECGFLYAQGFLCNRPIPVEEFEDLYMENKQ